MIAGLTYSLNEDAVPKKLGINCPGNCTFHPSKIGWDAARALMATRARGAGARTFQARAEEILGFKTAETSIHRHFKHYVEAADAPGVPNDEPKPTDIEILDSIIGAGFKNSRNWKPSIRDTLDAMKLKTQMTGNSAFDDLIKLFDVDDDEEEEEIEAEEAILSPEERLDDS